MLRIINSIRTSTIISTSGIIIVIYTIILLLIKYSRIFWRVKTPFKWFLPAGVVIIILLLILFLPKGCEEYVPLGIEVSPQKEFSYKPFDLFF